MPRERTTRRARAAAALALVALLAPFIGACGDDDDVTTSPTADETATTSGGEGTTTETPSTETPTTADAATSPTYEFAVQPGPGFNPTAGVGTFAVGQEITSFFYPGQSLALEYIELDPEGDPCPTGDSIELGGASGEVLATGEDGQVTVPDDAPPGPASITVRCERNGEPGIGVLEPIVIGSLIEVTATPDTAATSEATAIEVTGPCPEGTEAVAGLTPEDADFAVFAEPVPLTDGTATVTMPAGLPEGTVYATVLCTDDDGFAVGFTPVVVVEGEADGS